MRALPERPGRPEHALQQQETLERDHRRLGPLQARDHALAYAGQIGQALLAQARDLPSATQVAPKSNERLLIVEPRVPCHRAMKAVASYVLIDADCTATYEPAIAPLPRLPAVAGTTG